MNIWNILEIEPTTDRKAIRRAYAARSKVVHPEEKPEEFRILYEAYQQALDYAKRGGVSASFSVREEPEKEAEQEEKITEEPKNKRWTTESLEEEPPEDPLVSFFEKHVNEREQYVQDFVRHWMAFSRERRTPERREWWEEYLWSKEFQSIKWHPQVVKLLAEELEKRFTYEKNFKLLLWQAYDFQKDESAYQGDTWKLFHILYTEYEMKVMIDGLHQKQAYERKVWKRRFIAAGILLLMSLPFWIYHQVTAKQRFAVSYLEKTYPGVPFSDPEEKEDRYYFHNPEHPEFEVVVEVSKSSDGRGYKATDNYAVQLLTYYAEQYELSCGVVKEVPTLYYSDENEIEPFCQKVLQMFQEEEELRWIKEVGICEEDVLFPEVMIDGGVYSFPYPEKQVYEAEELSESLEVEELIERVREACIFYWFNYEAWNLTEEQYLEWGPEYEVLGEASFTGGESCSLYQGEEKVCTIYLPHYTAPEFTKLGEHTQTSYVPMMTVGNAYHRFLTLGANVTVMEDGSGFTVEDHGRINIYGKGAGITLKYSEIN